MNRRDFFTLSLGATAMIISSKAAAQSSLEAKVDILLREHVAAWNRADLDAMFDAFTEDAIGSTLSACTGAVATR